MAEKEFHESRIMWAIFNGDIHQTVSSCSHKEWLKPFLNEKNNFEDIVRGYIRNYEDHVDIIFYKGSKFEPCPIYEEDLLKLVDIARNNYGNKSIIIHSGVIVGKPGDVWKPMCFIKSYLLW